MRGIFVFGVLVLMIAGLVSLFADDGTEAAIYISAEWLLIGIGCLDNSIRER